jgi:multicomponent Na+:H+ antiporter subunit F
MTTSSILLGIAGVLLVGGLGPCLLAVSRGDGVARLAALNVAGPLTVLLCLVLAAAFQRSSYVDVALVLAPVSFAGTLVYARFLERWL